MNLSSGIGNQWMPKRGSSFTHSAGPVVEDVHRKRYIANSMQRHEPTPIGTHRR